MRLLSAVAVLTMVSAGIASAEIDIGAGTSFVYVSRNLEPGIALRSTLAGASFDCFAGDRIGLISTNSLVIPLKLSVTGRPTQFSPPMTYGFDSLLGAAVRIQLARSFRVLFGGGIHLSALLDVDFTVRSPLEPYWSYGTVGPGAVVRVESMPGSTVLAYASLQACWDVRNILDPAATGAGQAYAGGISIGLHAGLSLAL